MPNCNLKYKYLKSSGSNTIKKTDEMELAGDQKCDPTLKYLLGNGRGRNSWLLEMKKRWRNAKCHPISLSDASINGSHCICVCFRYTNLGNLNCPSSDPSLPKDERTLPLTSNICTRWLLLSDTMTLFVLLTAM